MTTIIRHLERLVIHGAVIRVYAPPVPMRVLAAVRLLDGPRRLRWWPMCAGAGGFDLAYDGLLVEPNRRDIAVVHNGGRVAYITTMEESGLQLDTVIEAVAMWRGTKSNTQEKGVINICG